MHTCAECLVSFMLRHYVVVAISLLFTPCNCHHSYDTLPAVEMLYLCRQHIWKHQCNQWYAEKLQTGASSLPCPPRCKCRSGSISMTRHNSNSANPESAIRNSDQNIE